MKLAAISARRVMNIMSNEDMYSKQDELVYQVTIKVTCTTILGETYEDDFEEIIHWAGYARMSAEMQAVSRHNFVNSVKSEITKCVKTNVYMPDEPPFGGYLAITLDY